MRALVSLCLVGCYATLPNPPPRDQTVQAERRASADLELPLIAVRVGQREPSDFGVPKLSTSGPLVPLARARQQVIDATPAERPSRVAALVTRLAFNAEKLPQRDRVPLWSEAERALADALANAEVPTLRRAHAQIAVRLGDWPKATTSYGLVPLTADDAPWAAWAALVAGQVDVAANRLGATGTVASPLVAWTLWRLGRWDEASRAMSAVVVAEGGGSRVGEWLYMAIRARPLADIAATARRLESTPVGLYTTWVDVQQSLAAVGRFADASAAVDLAFAAGTEPSPRDRVRLRYLQAEYAMRSPDLSQIGTRAAVAWAEYKRCGAACDVDADALRDGIAQLARFAGALYVTTRDGECLAAVDAIVAASVHDSDLTLALRATRDEVTAARTADAVGLGAHDRDEAGAMWRLHQVGLETCVERSLNRETEITLAIEAQYTQGGVPTAVQVTGTTDARLKACLESEVATWSLPRAPAGVTKVRAPLQLIRS